MPISWSQLKASAQHLLDREDESTPTPLGVFVRATYHRTALTLATELLRALREMDLDDVPVHPVSGRRGDWTRVRSGGRHYPHDPRASEIVLDDIWWALSHTCRFGGHCDRFYSVLSHSLMVADMAVLPAVCGQQTDMDRRHLYRIALLHDGTEAYLGDVVRPLKRHLPGYRALENLTAAAIGMHADMGMALVALPHAVKVADNLALAVEARDMCGDPQDWTLPYVGDYPNVIAQFKVRSETPEQARDRAALAWATV